MRRKVRVPEERELKAQRYVEGVACGMTKKSALLAAGYSPKVKSSNIDRLPCVKDAIETLERQRENLSKVKDYTFTDVAMRMVKRAKGSENERVQTDNDKAFAGLMGYNAPSQVNVKSVGLLMEFRDLSSAELAELRETLVEGGL